jgi:hypothetical protein
MRSASEGKGEGEGETDAKRQVRVRGGRSFKERRFRNRRLINSAI